MLSVIMLSVILHNVIMLSVIMCNVIMLSVIMQSVMAPFIYLFSSVELVTNLVPSNKYFLAKIAKSLNSG
jgi:hypothetical protein